MKKLFSLLVLWVVSALLTVGVFAAEKAVYLAAGGSDENDGTSYSTAVKTVERAYSLIGEGDGTVIVCSYVGLGADYVFPKHDGVITFTSTDGKNYFSMGKLAFTGTLTLSGDVKFERTCISSSGTCFIAAAGNNLTIGKNVETVGSISILAGYNVAGGASVADASIANDFTITVASGDFTNIRGGNRRAAGTSPFGMLSGNCTINIVGGNFTEIKSYNSFSTVTGMNEQSGNVTLNIAGGTFYGNLFAISRAGTNGTQQIPKITGNVTINVTGGAINGSMLNEKQDGAIDFEGKYTLNLVDGSLPLVEEIKGESNSVINVSSSLLNGTGTVNSTYKNPLRGGPDPWVTYHDGYYYMVIVSGTTISCFKSATLDGLAYVPAKTIWRAPNGDEINETNKMYSADIWSGELHYVDEKEFGEEYAGWWLYFAADDGDNVNHRLYAVRALTDDATGEYGHPVTKEVNVPVKILVDNDKTWAIGQSLLRVDGTTYMTWTSETGRGTADFKQDIRIAKLANPYTLSTDSNVICVPEYVWETKGSAYNATTGASYPKVVEGATAVYGDNGEVMIIYSASGYWTSYYCLASLTLKPGANPLLKDSWVKSEQPIFQKQYDVHGPGHAAYTTDAAGNRFMIYHAYLDWKKTSRYVFLQPYTLNGTTIDMNGGPYPQSTTFTVVNKVTPLSNVIVGFGR